MMRARFVENETGVEVVAELVYAWGEDGPRAVIVDFPELSQGVPGRRYGILRETFDRHFSMCPNQVIEARAIGNDWQQRPTKLQRELDEAAQQTG